MIKYETILKKIDEIIPYTNNPRKNDDSVRFVANSIKKFGWQQPIVIDDKNVIIAGHTRYKAAIELGLKEVPVHIAKDLTEAQVRAYRLADNKSADRSEWDQSKLVPELSFLSDVMDMSDFGFDEIEIDLKENIEDVELKPFTKALILISVDINYYDKVLKILQELDKVPGCIYEQSTHAD